MESKKFGQPPTGYAGKARENSQPPTGYAGKARENSHVANVHPVTFHQTTAQISSTPFLNIDPLSSGVFRNDVQQSAGAVKFFMKYSQPKPDDFPGQPPTGYAGKARENSQPPTGYAGKARENSHVANVHPVTFHQTTAQISSTPFLNIDPLSSGVFRNDVQQSAGAVKFFMKYSQPKPDDFPADKKIKGDENRSKYYQKYRNLNYRDSSSTVSRPTAFRMRMYADDEELKAKRRRLNIATHSMKGSVHSRLGVKYTAKDLKKDCKTYKHRSPLCAEDDEEEEDISSSDY